MNEWEIGAAVLGAGLIPCLLVCLLAEETSALAGLEVASVLLASALMMLAEGLHRQSFIDLALIFALLSMLGSLAFARLMERDL
jgi:multisubunit Na+/H+ antiporter MnhF subunit